MADKPIILDPALPMGADEERLEIRPAGFYCTVGVQPTVCLFACGHQHVNLRLRPQDAEFIGQWLLDQAKK